MKPVCFRLLGLDLCLGGAPQVSQIHSLAESATSPSSSSSSRGAATAAPLYPSRGGAAMASPRGYRVNALRSGIGRGRGALRRAAAALESSEALHLPWVRVWRRGRGHRWAEGDAVVVAARLLPLVWAVGVNHVVAVRRTRTSLALSWGTSPRHSLRGEEVVAVALDRDHHSDSDSDSDHNRDHHREHDSSSADDVVTFTLRSFSRPAAPAAFLCYPVVVLLQRRFARDVRDRLAKIANDDSPQPQRPKPADAAIAARRGAAVRDGILRRHRRQDDTSP